MYLNVHGALGLMRVFLNQRHGTYSDGKIYVIEVRDTYKNPSINIGINEVYDPKLDKWKNSLKSKLTNRSGLFAVSVKDQIYVFVGEYPFDEEAKRTFNNKEIYHPTTDTRTSGTPLLTARHGLAAVAINETIYLIGGGPEP